MNIVEVLTLIISLLALLVTYLVFKSNETPRIVIYATPHYGKETFIRLHVKNIGKGIAEKVVIKSSQPVPRRAFGITKLNQHLEFFESGIFKHGIELIFPNQEYVYDWGQYGGLVEALNDKPITFEVSYKYRYPLSLWKSPVSDRSVINIRELEALPSTTGSLIEQIGKIHRELEQLNKQLPKVSK